jgi:NADH:ubiquinone oxidoreductase subunit 5 (subunit L)/multisubunit Na+/H+ antiporter MnhA subunit
MFEIDSLLVLIPALPLAAAVLTALLGRHVLGRQSHLLAVAAIALSCAASMLLVFQVYQQSEESEGIGYEKVVTLWTWADVAGAYQTPEMAAETAAAGMEGAQTHDFQIEIALRADPLTAFMLATVTLISLLVAV